MKERFLDCMRLQYPLGTTPEHQRDLVRLWCMAWCECARAVGKRLPQGDLDWVSMICGSATWMPDASWRWWDVPFGAETTVDLRRGDPLIKRVEDLKRRGVIE